MVACVSGTRCPPINPPSNGEVTYESLSAGSTATYSCERRYKLVGSSGRTCLDDGTWGGRPPSCKRELFHYV